jgi:hypothetical protein
MLRKHTQVIDHDPDLRGIPKARRMSRRYRVEAAEIGHDVRWW